MKPYGLPRDDGVSFPDKGDICHFGLKSKHGKLNSKRKKATRVFWKKKARYKAKQMITKFLNSSSSSSSI